MNRHLCIVGVALVLSLDAGLAFAQEAAPDVAEARRDAEQARRDADQARRQALRQAEQARRDAQRQAQDDARAQADEARARVQAQARQAQQAARDERARARSQLAAEGRVYTPGPFDSLVVDGAGQVRLVQGDRDEVFVAGDADAQEAVDISLNGKRLNIDLPGSWKFWRDGRGAQVEVRVRHLSRLVLAGANDVIAPGLISGDDLTLSMAGSGVARFDQLEVGSVNVDISGAGEGRLSGKVDQLRLSVSGKGKVGAEQLKAGSADVSISGVGNASLWAVKTLRVQISGAGHVEYWGQPAVTQAISGFGSVERRGAKE